MEEHASGREWAPRVTSEGPLPAHRPFGSTCGLTPAPGLLVPGPSEYLSVGHGFLCNVENNSTFFKADFLSHFLLRIIRVTFYNLTQVLAFKKNILGIKMSLSFFLFLFDHFHHLAPLRARIVQGRKMVKFLLYFISKRPGVDASVSVPTPHTSTGGRRFVVSSLVFRGS